MQPGYRKRGVGQAIDLFEGKMSTTKYSEMTVSESKQEKSATQGS